LVGAQVILLSWWFNKKKLGEKNLVKKANQKDLVKMVRTKSTCPKWHFVQVGHGGKKATWGVFFVEIPGLKSRDFL
jgi:hypothetical protein